MTPRGQQIIAAMVDTRLAELASDRRPDMTPPTTTHGSPGGINDGGADALWYARAAIRSAGDLDDATVAEACRQIIATPDPDVTENERIGATHMLCLVEGEMV